MDMADARSLYRKLVKSNSVKDLGDGEVLLYIDLHVMNEYTSPQAFSGLSAAKRKVWRPEAHLAIVDHVNSTRRRGTFADPQAALLIDTLEDNCRQHGIHFIGLDDERQGIEHIVVPEQGLARPGMVIACGDSHTTTYGAFGALGFGIGTSEVEHILATQTLVYRILDDMRITIDGTLGLGVSAKDVIMVAIAQIGAGGANGCAVEFAGSAIDALSMAGRMTICNMAVELGARAALMAPSERVYAHVAQTSNAPDGPVLAEARMGWDGLRSDAEVKFSRDVSLDASAIAPLVSWGTSPDQTIPISAAIPDPGAGPDSASRRAVERALAYMGLTAGQPLSGIAIDKAFIGSCTNSRLEDLREAASILRGRQVAPNVEAIVVPGSRSVARAAEAEGLDNIFRAAGFQWRQESGCSMCLAMNDDVAKPGERVASSTNRNFEGRQGAGARTHLMSPAMVAAAAVAGHLTDVRSFKVSSDAAL